MSLWFGNPPALEFWPLIEAGVRATLLTGMPALVSPVPKRWSTRPAALVRRDLRVHTIIAPSYASSSPMRLTYHFGLPPSLRGMFDPRTSEKRRPKLLTQFAAWLDDYAVAKPLWVQQPQCILLFNDPMRVLIAQGELGILSDAMVDGELLPERTTPNEAVRFGGELRFALDEKSPTPICRALFLAGRSAE